MLRVKRAEKKLLPEKANKLTDGALCLTEVNEPISVPRSPHKDVTFKREVSSLLQA